jgi:hypothetical protein
MVVAVKEFSQAVLMKALSTIKAVDAGRIPPRLTRPRAAPLTTWITADDISSKPIEVDDPFSVRAPAFASVSVFHYLYSGNVTVRFLR